MKRLVLAEVLKPQGIRGELKIKTFTDTPEVVKQFGTVYIDDVAYKILSFRIGNDGAAYVGLYLERSWEIGRASCRERV